MSEFLFRRVLDNVYIALPIYSVTDRFYADATSNTSSDIVVGWYVELTYCARSLSLGRFHTSPWTTIDYYM